MALWKEKFELGVHVLPKELDEEVARLHLDKLGVQLTTLSREQAKYLGIPVEGPFKPEHGGTKTPAKSRPRCFQSPTRP